MWEWSRALTEFQVNLGAPEAAAWFVTYFIGAFVLINAALLLALTLIWVTRKSVGRIQDRLGPNRLGPAGFFQQIADVLKLLTKEDITPYGADYVAYNLAPVFSVFGTFLGLAVIAFAPGLIGVDLNVGVLYFTALGSVGIMAALLAGWSSNNKYALLAGFRVVAQLISYEIPMVLAMLMPVLLVGSMRFGVLTDAQRLSIFGFNIGLGWMIFIMPAAFLIFFIAALAESENTPFDLLEAESELIAGMQIEYSGMKFAMFYLAQFLNSFFLGAVAVMLFLGGWQGPFVDQLPILGLVYFMLKGFAMYFVIQWVRGTFPRIRVDQMLAFAWKGLVPLTLALLLWQMIAMKLFTTDWIQDLSILVGNLMVLAFVLRTVGRIFRDEEITTKRAFEPKSLIGTMEPAPGD